jgi:integrase
MSASNSAATRPRPVSGDAEREVAALLWLQVGQAFQWAARLDRVVDRDGASRVRSRDARSSFATLLIYEGQPPPYVAEQLGHSPATILRLRPRLGRLRSIPADQRGGTDRTRARSD